MTADDPNADDALVEVLSARLDKFERFAAEGVVGWMEDAGISLAEVRVLLALADGKSRRGSELAEVSGLSVDITYQAMQKIDARGWLGEEHRHHHLTEAGHETVAALAATRRRAVSQFVASLSPDERRDLADALGVG